jgi:crossover junction endodeoxyribonuclease RuvC
VLICGLDPGLSGALFLLSADRSFGRAYDMPTHSLARGGKDKREIDIHALVALLNERRPGHVFIEQVGAMPGQGATSMFAFGKGYGIVLGACAALGLPFTLVHPRAWKKALGVPPDKDGARARASQLLPAYAEQWPRKKDDGKAEAALLAHWGILAFEKIGEAA